MDKGFYSVRMRCTDGKDHLSGAERLVRKEEVERVMTELTRRGLDAAGGRSVKISCSVEAIDPEHVRFAGLPDLEPFNVTSYPEGRLLASELLESAGVPAAFAKKGMKLLVDGPGPDGRVMRGAVIIDVVTGDRLEADPARGVRVSRMDLTDECRRIMQAELFHAGLGHRRVIEALTLAGKVIAAPGIVAELCWSDDPTYTSGYVASPGRGYQRISFMKEQGDCLGGRVFFFDSSRAGCTALIDYLENTPVLFNAPGKILADAAWVSRHG